MNVHVDALKQRGIVLGHDQAVFDNTGNHNTLTETSGVTPDFIRDGFFTADFFIHKALFYMLIKPLFR
jgi:hypothetical protein